MKLVTVKTFDNPIEAHIVRAKFKSEQLVCFLFDENIVGVNPLYNISVGGIKLKVKKSDMEKAIVIIDAIEKSPLMNEEGEIVKCSVCGSKDIYGGFKSMKGVKGMLSIIIALLFTVFPIYYKAVNKCKDCDAEF